MLRSRQSLFLLFLSLVAVHAHAEVIPMTRSVRGGQLLYAHLVVECGVSFLEVEQTTVGNMRNLASQPSMEMDIYVAHLADVTVLRGANPVDIIVVDYDLNPAEWSGKPVLLCAYWNARLSRYVVQNRSSVYVWEEDAWARLDRVEILSTNEVTTLIRSVSVPELVRNADLIVAGKRACQDFCVTDPSSSAC